MVLLDGGFSGSPLLSGLNKLSSKLSEGFSVYVILCYFLSFYGFLITDTLGFLSFSGTGFLAPTALDDLFLFFFFYLSLFSGQMYLYPGRFLRILNWS
jgi:hypothetical protein